MHWTANPEITGSIPVLPSNLYTMILLNVLDYKACVICNTPILKKRKDRPTKYCSSDCYHIDRRLKSKNNGSITNYSFQVTYRKKFPERRRAHCLVEYALKNGSLKKMPCVKCGNQKSEAHHEDYSKPLEVKWLCRPCHLKEHNSFRKV